MSENPPIDASLLMENLGGASDVVVAIDADYNISYFNEEAEKVFCYNKDEILGKPLVVLLPKYARSKHNQYVKQFASSGDSNRQMGDRMAVSGLTKDGEILILDVSIHKHENEEIHRYSAVCRKLC